MDFHLNNPILPVNYSAQATYRACDSRMAQEALRRHVLRVLRCWRERFLFGDDFLAGLQARFLLSRLSLCFMLNHLAIGLTTLYPAVSYDHVPCSRAAHLARVLPVC